MEYVGAHGHMKDTTCSFASIPEDGLENFSFYAVFDGHGSAVVSEYLKKEMISISLFFRNLDVNNNQTLSFFEFSKGIKNTSII